MRKDLVRTKLDAALTEFLAQQSDQLENGIPEGLLVSELARLMRVHFVSWRVDSKLNGFLGGGNLALSEHVSEGGAALDAAPDIVVHRRQNSGKLVALDVKSMQNGLCPECDDKNELWVYRLPPFSYQHAAFLRVGWLDGAPHLVVDFS
jgi:hypothetical protein